jgi:hypothetical protein
MISKIHQSVTLNEIFAHALEQFYQIIDVTTLGKEAINVHAQYPAPVEHRRRDPGFTTSLNLLLQSLL